MAREQPAGIFHQHGERGAELSGPCLQPLEVERLQRKKSRLDRREERGRERQHDQQQTQNRPASLWRSQTVDSLLVRHKAGQDSAAPLECDEKKRAHGDACGRGDPRGLRRLAALLAAYLRSSMRANTTKRTMCWSNSGCGARTRTRLLQRAHPARGSVRASAKTVSATGPPQGWSAAAACGAALPPRGGNLAPFARAHLGLEVAEVCALAERERRRSRLRISRSIRGRPTRAPSCCYKHERVRRDGARRRRGWADVRRRGRPPRAARACCWSTTKAWRKKIAISGGGRCNFTNLGATCENYLSEQPAFCKSALARYTPWDFVALVEKHGIAYHEKKLGQQFCDGSSRQIIEMLLAECASGGGGDPLNCRVGEVTKPDRFRVETAIGAMQADSVVIATGGLSFPKLGASDLGYRSRAASACASRSCAPDSCR